MASRETVERIRTRALEAGWFFPLGIYDRVSDAVADLDAKSVRKLLDDLVGRGQDVMAPVQKRIRSQRRRISAGERQARDSVTASVVDVPIANYDAMTVAQIKARLPRLSRSDLERIKLYEASTKKRKTVIDAVDAKLTA